MAKKKTTLLMKTPKSPCSLQLSGGMRIMFLKYLRKGLLILSLLVTGCQNVSGQPLPGLKTTEPRIINTPLTPNENSTQLIPTLRLTEELTMEPTGTLEVNRTLSFANIKPGQYLLISLHENEFSPPSMKICYKVRTRLTQRSFLHWCYEPDV